ncbi:MAG: hypothetical protein ABEI96_07310 [Haloarculaceae archaeon]
MSALSPKYRDTLLAVVAVAALAAPLWTPALHLDDPQYRYESVVIETDGSHVAFATDPGEYGVGISDDVVCAEGAWSRSCVFERYVAANNTVPTAVYSGNPDYLHTDAPVERYDFVFLNGTAYETVYPANRSVTKHGGARLDLGLRKVAADRALSAVAVPADEVSKPVRRAAKTGVAYGYRAAVPDTPVALGEDTYRRVYVADVIYPPDDASGTASLLTYGGLVAGLALLGWLRTRFDVAVRVRHVDEE